MNFTVPGWTMDEDLRSFHELYPTPNEKISTQADNELVELLWENGSVVMQSQNNRKHQESTQTKPSQKVDLKPDVPVINPSTLIQDDEWLQYAMDDSLEKAFGCELLSDIPTTSTLYSGKLNKAVMAPPKSTQMNSNLVNCESLNFPHFLRPPAIEDMPPPKTTQMLSGLNNSESINFPHFSRQSKGNIGLSNSIVGASACGSNQVHYQNDVSCMMNIAQDKSRTNTFNTTLTSSSGGSGCSHGRNSTQQSTGRLNNKRKVRDAAESECDGEEAEYESMEANKSSQQTSYTRKSRAAEVHNLSERRRRDKINEKMRALQELIPHCNKSDKASMLDEAIEYLKSLQLQLQVMWMGSGMAPIIFPNIQQYMSQISTPSISNQVQFPRNQMPMYSSQNMNPVNFSTQIQNAHMPVSYNGYLGYPHMQMPPQGMNLYTYGSNMVQLNQTPVVAGSNSLPTAVITSENIQNGHLG